MGHAGRVQDVPGDAAVDHVIDILHRSLTLFTMELYIYLLPTVDTFRCLFCYYASTVELQYTVVVRKSVVGTYYTTTPDSFYYSA